MPPPDGLKNVRRLLTKLRNICLTHQVPPELGKPLLLYLSVIDNDFGCLLGQHDDTGRKEQVIYYLSKKFTLYKARYTLLERTCCVLTWVAQRLRYYLSAYTTYLISRMDPLKYIFPKPMPTGKLAKRQILLSEFDIMYVTQKAVKGQALADHLTENPVDQDYRPLKTYFPDKKVLFAGEDISESYNEWRMFFDGAVNFNGVRIGAVLVSKIGQHYPISAKIRFSYMNNMAEYETCILELRMAVDMDIKELLVIGDSDLLIHQHPDKNYINPINVEIYDQQAYCFHVDQEPNRKPWYYDIKRLLGVRGYPEGATDK
ncbi:uncharacterized protein LOC124889608 [Capsicum annuum]|uniref:uncharacterized protein LOC124889608 n=1 Tax=Capsicum annuum TaxID=4072 RepID=UPI001FB186CD|nr:uncharacterized protein LOC124889608 [Capsicum annuum]